MNPGDLSKLGHLRPLDLAEDEALLQAELLAVARGGAVRRCDWRRGVAARWPARAGWRATDLLSLASHTQTDAGKKKEKKRKKERKKKKKKGGGGAVAVSVEWS
ncbi:hypothetical protein JCGZ_16290 [Jatropha curcas]|uniref:Uncharacterized protein n=1 Tax=Jatropha curcas TaxID=180498 RepID=A0A067L7R1_JATCU|nr:hypothetical protein JCGZ_16290 [Jatropha curcas]